MANAAPCLLPRFSPAHHGPKRPVSMRLKIAPEQNLQLLSAWNRAQLNSLLKTAWVLLLHHYTGSEDICFGYQHVGADERPSSASQSSETPTLPEFRIAISEEDSVQNVFDRVDDVGDLTSSTSGTETCGDLSANSNGYLQFNTIVMVRTCSSVRPALTITLPEECRVRLHVKVLHDDIGIFLEWWNDEMSTEHMKSIASYFGQLIDKVASSGEESVGQLDLFSEQDWSRLCKFNSILPQSYDRCIHDIIHDRTQEHPEKEAVCSWDGSLSYRELDHLASQVAHHLRIQGVGPEVRVALCFDKSKWNIVAMLGVLKAGGAFVPLDPTHPTTRLQSLVRSVEARILLCSRNRAQYLVNVTDMVVPLDDMALDDFSNLSSKRAQLEVVQGCNAAYVIFTSGSTGEPKGTLLEHRAYVSSAFAHAASLGVRPDSRCLQFAAHTFDASLVEILTTLMQGACVCIPSEDARLNDIEGAINDMNVTQAALTPSFVKFVDASKVPSLETLVLAGEAMSADQLATWSKINLVNAYGPTESAVAAVVHPGIDTSSDCRDIGLPVGVRVWVVDPSDHRKLVPIGCPGELLLEGPTLARCYLNNPQKTDEVFVRGPPWMSRDGITQSDWRFYKTGDLVRYNSDSGSLTYIGRKDTQVKFHGQRIELGEIENQLAIDSAINHCLVLLPKSGFAQGKLVAVWSPSEQPAHPDQDPAPLKLLEISQGNNEVVSSIRDRLSARLPTYMVPSVWLGVETFAFLTSGKLDRKMTARWVGDMEKDPTVQISNVDGGERVTVSENALEDQLASIYSRVLNVPKSHVALDASFLSMGGDSIAAITCVGMCKKQGIGLTVQEVLHSKSIRELATHAKEIKQPTVYQETIEEPFGLSPIQRLHFMARKEGQGHFNQSILARLNRKLDESKVRRAIEILVMRHSMLRSRLIERIDGGLEQKITQDVTGSFSLSTHSLRSEDKIEEEVARSQSSINAFVGPVFAVKLFHIDEASPILSLVAHHLVVDIVSWRIILEDLEDLLLNPSDKSSQNDSLPFQTWLRLQNERTQEILPRAKQLDSIESTDLAYWGVTDRQLTYGDVECETFELDAKSSQSLLMNCQQTLQLEAVDIFIASILHSFGQTFADRTLPVLYNEGHGREAWDSSMDISRTVGWFTILYPIMVSSFVAEDPVETLIRVKDIRRRVTDNGRQDFARRMFQGEGNKDFGHSCPMEIVFNYVGQHRDLQRQDGLFQLMSQMAGETGKGGGAADFGSITPRFSLLESSAMAVHGRLRFTFSFSRHIKQKAMVRDWVSRCHDLLKSLAETLPSLAPRPTLSSFPMLSLTYDELDAMMSKKLPSVGIDSPELIEDIYPCSRMQQGILLSRSRDSSLYAVHDTFEVKGPEKTPDIKKLEVAWQRVVAHHAMLRTFFVENLTSNDLFCQVVLKAVDSRPVLVKCSKEEDVLETLDSLPPMHYRSNQPPFQFTICQIDNGKLFCRLELNHAAMDGNSISIIMRDLQLAYEGKLDVDRRPVFKNYIRYLQDIPQDESLDYWCSYFSNYKPCHFPVLNDGKPSEKELRTLRLNIDFYQDLQKACENNGLTLSTAFSTAWGLTLRSFWGSDDVCFSYMASLRDAPVEDIESVIGPIINVLGIRINIEANTSLGEVLHNVQNGYMQNLPYRHTSLIDIQHALKLSHTTLFNSGVSYRRIPSKDASSGHDIQFQEIGSIHDPAEFPLFINVEVSDTDAQIELNYWSSALSDGQAANVSSTFTKSLENIVRYQDEEVRSIDALSQSHKQQIGTWNKETPEATDKCLHDVLEEMAKSQPDAVAVSSLDEQFTYSELHNLSSRLAAYLEKFGVGPGDLLPIDFDNSIWTIVALLAVSKVGGVCVPLAGISSQYAPGEWLVKNNVQVALTSPQRAQLLEGTIPYVVSVDQFVFEYFPSSDEFSKPQVQSSNDVYVVFTAGESSSPRAVVLSHATILTRGGAFASALHLNSATKMFQFAHHTSDMFIQELFGTMISGGRTCIPSNHDQSNLAVSINALHANSISLTPSLASSIRPSDVPEIQVLALHGESVTKQVRDIWTSKVQLHTFYGTAECSSTCIHDSDINTFDETQKIGFGLECNVWLVDPSNHNVLVPIGCAGELVIEAPALPHALHDETKANRSFIEDPLWSLDPDMVSEIEGSDEMMSSSTTFRRMFKTGDLARYNSDGSLVYLGKKHAASSSNMQTEIWQTKQAIDNFLLPDRHCVVEPVNYGNQTDSTEDLVVFVLLENEATNTHEDSHIIARPSTEFRSLVYRLHTHLTGILPTTQIPKLYFPIPKTPLTSCGKLDRQLLKDAVDTISANGLLGVYEFHSRTADISFWKNHLNDVEACMFPPLSPQAASNELGHTKLQLRNLAALQNFCRGVGVSADILLQVVWGLILRCYTGQEEVCFGYCVSEQTDIMASRLHLKDDMKIFEALKRRRQDVEQILEHPVAFSQIQPELGLDGASLFNTVFRYDEASEVSDNDFDITPWLSTVHTDNNSISVSARISELGGEIVFAYSTNEISEGSVMDIIECFDRILRSMVDSAKSTIVIGDVDFFTETSCQQLREWNAALTSRPSKFAHEIIQDQAKALPLSAPAICSWDGDFTYTELDILSTKLAHHLVAMGVKAETFVGLCFEKSAWAVISQIAVLKSGGAFAPLGDNHPESRLKGLVEDLGATIVLCSAKNHAKVSKICKTAFIVNMSTVNQPIKIDRTLELPRPAFENAAYALFTSGTTGKPKATVIEHAGLAATAPAFSNAFFINSQTRLFQFTSYTFDVSLIDTIVGLMNGACVCIPTEEERMNDLAGAINRMNANTIVITPTVTGTLDPQAVPSLKTMLIGGEKFVPSQLERWAGRCVINGYGPTEATMAAVSGVKIDPNGTLIDNDCTSIGKAIYGRTWIVDPHNHHRLVPVGAVGELVLEGCNVGRGYLNNPEKTNEVFIHDPKWIEYEGLRKVLSHRERMYKTGDLVRYKPNGDICFISRKDTQIKLNGQRIELEEIEKQCVQHLPEGAQVAVEVITPQTKTVAKCLAAFFTVDEGKADHSHQGGEDAELLLPMTESLIKIVKRTQASLTEVLPVAMIPRLFFPVRHLPLAATGKMDRKRLRATVETLSKEELRLHTTFESGSKQVSENAMEIVLRGLWEEALGLEAGSVGAEDSFFAIGGDSLTAMKLVGALNARGISLTFIDIYKSPVLTDMAKSCESLSTGSSIPTVEPFSLLPESTTREAALEEVSDLCRVAKESVSDIYPCSPVQEGLLTLSVKQQGAYVARPMFKLTEKVDIARFQDAWQKTVNEMDILRTRIVHTESSNFLQAVLKSEQISWTTAMTLDDAMNETLELPKHNGGALTGYAIVESDEYTRYFVWTIHHALYDGWSIPLILKRVEENYSGMAVENLTLGYKHFISHLLERDTSQSDEFWKSHLSGLSSSPFPQSKTSLPDSVRVGNRHYNKMAISRAPDTVDLTMPELIRAAWAVTVSAHTGSGDVCFGETLMGRNIRLSGITNIAGPVLTTVPVRIQVDNELSVTEYLDNVRQLTTEMIPHQHSGLQQIRRLSKDTALACDFKNLLVIQIQQEDDQGDLWSAGENQTDGDFFTHPLVVECKAGASQMEITMHHDEIILDSLQAERLIHQFGFVLEQLLSISKGESRKVSSIEVSSPFDKAQIATWNERHIASDERCAHEIIREKALAQPDSPALCAWDGQLSYREMHRLASAFATYLTSRGVGPETMVPICMDKSLWAVVTMLSILIAGGAYVPLDPAHPTSRHKEILEEVDARIILCSPQHQSRYSGLVKLIIPVSKETIRAYSSLVTGKQCPNRATPSNMAYAIFTSGSTGRAKGIIIDHRALTSSIMAFGPGMLFSEKSRVFQFASLTFDAAVLEIFTTLMHGGCVCIPSEDERLNDVAGAIRRMNVTWTFLTPSIASIIEPSTVPSLEVVTCGGEKMSNEVITKWAHKVKLMNGYGPTETVIFAVVETDVAATQDPARIGYGIPCTLTWVVDPDNHDKLSPLGAIGELALEGPALAREYLKNSAKTSEAFVEEPSWIKDFPHSLQSPRRIYKTGDLVRYNHDGSIEYISRKDHQVKLHGQRMELGEIEHRLYEDTRVRHAVVILPKTGPLKQRLVTVMSLNSITSDKAIISDNACELVSREYMSKSGYSELVAVQQSLENQLPIYMVPQTWAVIKGLPMLVSGKLDRKRITAWLEDIDESSYDRIMEDYDNIKRGNVEEPCDEEKETSFVKFLRGVFEQVLNLPANKINPERSFVSLGGDSITGMSVVSKARKLGLNLTLNKVLQSKSITELAQASDSTMTALHHKEKPDEEFNLSPIQRLYFQLPHAYEGVNRFNQSMTVRITRKLSPQLLESAIAAVIEQHSMFKARFSVSKDGHWKQKTSKDNSYRFRAHSVSGPGEIIPMISETQSCLDIQRGPVFAADLFEQHNGQQVLFVVANHLCVDMVSWRNVLQDLQDFIETGSLSPEKPLSFQSWCGLQNEHTKSEDNLPLFPVKSPNLRYWGMEGKPNFYGHVNMESFVLSEETTAYIMGGCHDVLRTETVEILLAAVIHSFNGVFTDRNTPTVYSEGHGREAWDPSIDLSRTVGWFTTLCPLHVEGVADYFNTLKLVKDTRRRIAKESQSYFAQSLLGSSESGSSKNFPVPFEIIFNYLGRLQQLERSDSLFQHYGDIFDAKTMESAGDMGPNTPRFALLELSAIIVKDKLHVSFTYNRHMKHQRKIYDWMLKCKQILEEDVLDLKDFVPEPTLSDYPLLPITYDGLKNMMTRVLPSTGIESWEKVEDIYPCSPVQEGILLSQVRNPQAYMFNVIFEIRNSENDIEIETKWLRKAWAKVVARHPVLRTLFIDSCYKGGSFDQIVVRAVDDDVIEFECDDSAAFDMLERFNLTDANSRRSLKLPQQLTICKTSSGRVFIKIDMNHAIIDGGSLDLVLRDMTMAYNDQLPAGQGPRFGEYVRYVRGQSQGKSLAHWVQYLAGVRPCLLSFSSETSKDRQLGSHMMRFDRFPEVQHFCEQNSVTLANLVLSAWAIVLGNFTGSNDVCFGYPSAGRDSPVQGIQDAVGIFINMLCCRVKFGAGHTLLDISRKVQNDHIRNLPYQNCSLAAIQHELGQKSEALFNTTISIQNHAAQRGSIENGISFEYQKAYDPTEYPITVNVETAKNQEGILLRYWTDVVPEHEAKRLADAIAQVLACFIEKPSMRVSELALFDDKPRASNSVGEDQHIVDSEWLQNLIDARVNEIISQMIKDGKLAIPEKRQQSKQPNRPHVAGSVDSFPTTDISGERDLSESIPTLTDDSGESTNTEKLLWGLWSSALSLPSGAIKRQASFFKLGGDSISAIKMVSAAREQGLTLTVSDVFNSPVFEDMLGVVKEKDTPSPPPTNAGISLGNDNEKQEEPEASMSRPMSPEQISMLGPKELDRASLQAAICPKIGVFRGAIADILPVTDFQSLSLTASMFKSRWMLTYFYLEGSGNLDLRRMRESFLRVVDAFDILRTVFVCFNGQFYQVVLRKIKPDIFVHETESTLDEQTESLQQRDREQFPRQGEQYVQFHIVKKKKSPEHRILIRMSHAQFDGMCIPRIMTAIKMGYEGDSIPPASFSNYMRLLPVTITPEHYQYWSNLLKGSRMTEVIRREGPCTFDHIGSYSEQRRTIEIPPRALGNVTIATVMQASWALTLAKMTAQTDVVFGLTISGRNATIPGVETTVGPCLNIIPIRVKFGERWTGLDLFRHLQDQQVANMPFESLGFREIIRHCTDWPDSTHFTTSVFHQNVEYEGQMALDNNTYRMGGAGVIDNFTDMTLISSSSSQQHSIDVSLGYSLKSAIHPTFAAKILDIVCDTAQRLINSPNITLPSSSTIRSLPSQIIHDIHRPSDGQFLSSNLKGRSISDIIVHSDLLSQVWQQVLSHKNNFTNDPSGPARDKNQPFHFDDSFFGLGGDIVNMAEVAWLLEQEGLHVRLEELLEHPTFLGQLAVLALKNPAEDSASEGTPEPQNPFHREPLKSPSTGALNKAMTLAKKITKWGGTSTKI